MCVCGCFSHHGSTFHGVTDDHDDPSSVVLQDSGCRTLHQLTIRVERCAEGNVDAARNVASAEAKSREVKEQSIEWVRDPV